MSKIGKINISIPEKVKVLLSGNNINIEGPQGKKTLNIDLDIFDLNINEGKEVTIKPKKVDQNTKRLWGMNRSLINNAIIGASGILIQFPLYFGIMGIMKYSGMINIFSDFFVEVSNEYTFPIYTFISAGIINLFVPSGGGQWGVQGPIIIEAATQIGVPYWKAVMALAYGDQITNMLQPFWALPLLGITGLKAKEILPYTIILFLVGSFIFIGGLIIF